MKKPNAWVLPQAQSLVLWDQTRLTPFPICMHFSDAPTHVPSPASASLFSISRARSGPYGSRGFPAPIYTLPAHLELRVSCRESPMV